MTLAWRISRKTGSSSVLKEIVPTTTTINIDVSSFLYSTLSLEDISPALPSNQYLPPPSQSFAVDIRK